MNKILTLTLAVAVSLGTVSCVKDFTARNTNQEQANEEMMDHDNMRTGSYISQMIANVLPSYQNDGSNEYGSASYQVVQGLTGNIFANYEAASNSGFHQTNEYNLVADGWTKALFEDAFVRAMAPWAKLNALRENSPYDAALGDVLKVAVLHRVTREPRRLRHPGRGVPGHVHGPGPRHRDAPGTRERWYDHLPRGL